MRRSSLSFFESSLRLLFQWLDKIGQDCSARRLYEDVDRHTWNQFGAGKSFNLVRLERHSRRVMACSGTLILSQISGYQNDVAFNLRYCPVKCGKPHES